MVGEAKDLTQGSPIQKIVVFTIPLLIGNVFQQLYNMVDMIIVGRTINTVALAAIGATGPIAFMVVGVSFGLTGGFTVITAQRYGAGDTNGVRRSIATSIVLSLGLSIIITAVCVSTAYPLFEIMQTPADIIDQSYSYIIVIYAGAIVTIFFNLFSGILRALGDSITPLLFLIIACVVNIVLDYILIVNFHMGVAGAGWATIISQAFSVVCCLVYSWRRFPVVRLRRQDWVFDWTFARKQLFIGLSMGTQMAIVGISVIIVQVAVNRFGTDTVKAFSAAMKIDQLATQPMFSLGVAMATYTAQNFGAGHMLRIKQGFIRAVVICISLGLLGFMGMRLGAPWLLGLFGLDHREPNVLYEATTFLSITSMFYLLLGLVFVFRNVMQGMGKTSIPIFSAMVEVGFRIFATIFFPTWWGFSGLCVINPATWFCAVCVLLTGYLLTMRRMGATISPMEPEYQSVVLNYDGQAKFASPTESVPSASVRLKLEKEPTPAGQKRNSDSVRIL